MTPEQEAARRSSLVSAARAVLILQMGLVPGCSRVLNAAFHLGRDFADEFETEFPAFVSVRSRTQRYPVSTERLHWNPESLLQLDAELAAVETELRPAVMAACFDVIAKYG